MHGGLRYLATGDVGLAWESARERAILLGRTAPHLVHPLPMVVPLNAEVSKTQARLAMAAYRVADATEAGRPAPAAQCCPAPAGCPSPRPSRTSPACVPRSCAAACCRGTASSRTTPAWSSPSLAPPRPHGARILTRCGATHLHAGGATVIDEHQRMRRSRSEPARS